ncbi:hypothetical protein LINGRAHAP2_LOCUS4162, partial [Linum grandiflorum]
SHHRVRNIKLCAHYPRNTSVLSNSHSSCPLSILLPTVSIEFLNKSIFIFHLHQDDRTSLWCKKILFLHKIHNIRHEPLHIILKPQNQTIRKNNNAYIPESESKLCFTHI